MGGGGPEGASPAPAAAGPEEEAAPPAAIGGLAPLILLHEELFFLFLFLFLRTDREIEALQTLLIARSREQKEERAKKEKVTNRVLLLALFRRF